jgi:hypothetical protein
MTQVGVAGVGIHVHRRSEGDDGIRHPAVLAADLRRRATTYDEERQRLRAIGDLEARRDAAAARMAAAACRAWAQEVEREYRMALDSE